MSLSTTSGVPRTNMSVMGWKHVKKVSRRRLQSEDSTLVLLIILLDIQGRWCTPLLWLGELHIEGLRKLFVHEISNESGTSCVGNIIGLDGDEGKGKGLFGYWNSFNYATACACECGLVFLL